ncbi:MAG: tetratricopeptide repeat protein [Bryobacteraceae bacterium]
MAAAFVAKQNVTREQARRKFALTERQLKSWERQGLLEPTEKYGFTELLSLQTLIKLRNDKVSVPQLRRALAALRDKLEHIKNPLTELRLYVDGGRVRVEVEGQSMEPESGQLLLNFDREDLKRLVKMPDAKVNLEKEARASAERWFERGLELEQTGAPVDKIIEAYETSIALDPHSAGALVNLGTIYFNARNWTEAERYYRKALEADPGYALAHFDLGNLFDERGDRPKAQFHYMAALRLNPRYADAHYNLALLYQATNQPLNAVGHWKSYLKLDPASNWAAIARRELTKLRAQTIVKGAGN